MKFLISLIFIQGLMASPYPYRSIGDFCWRDRCSDQQEVIWEEFQQTQWDSSIEAGFYTGGCYHLGHYDPSQPHFAGVLIDYKEGTPFFNGRFGFFFPQNPYGDWDLEVARDNLPERFQAKNQLYFYEDEAFIDYNPGDIPWFYWVKHSIDRQSLLVMGSWGATHQFICKLQNQ